MRLNETNPVVFECECAARARSSPHSSRSEPEIAW
jgi:hypothetical protein